MRKIYRSRLLLSLFAILLITLGIVFFLSRPQTKKNNQVNIVPSAIPTVLPTRTLKEKVQDIERNSSESAKLYSLTSGKFTRTYILHIPRYYDGRQPLPAIVAFHGGGDDAANMEKYTGLSTLADTYGFFVIYPNGYQNRWADGRGIGPGDSLGIDDVQFVHDILHTVSQKYKINKSKILATGFSAGGYFVHKLACEDSATFLAFVAVGASLPENIGAKCHPDHLRSMLLIIGTNDPSYLGWTTPTNIYIHSAEQTVQQWSTINQCLPVPTIKAGAAITINNHDHCSNDTAITLVTMQGIGHEWVAAPTEKNFDTGRVIAKYLLEFK